MCGIVGYIGNKKAAPLLLQGLSFLEYRGYDSAGIATYEGDKITCIKKKGKVKNLKLACKGKNLQGNIGIGHTRWATHGAPSDENSHPHFDEKKEFFVVHNGIIENYQKLRDYLENLGHTFNTETDTEVIPHLLQEFYDGDLFSTVKNIAQLLEGAYALVIMSVHEPETLIALRKGSPLVIGIAEDEKIIASDIQAFLSQTKKVIYLDDDEIAKITPTEIEVFDDEFNTISKDVELISDTIKQVEKGEYNFFMEKEIFEQPQSIKDSMRGRILADKSGVKLGGLDLVIQRLLYSKRFIFVGCGTALFAGEVGSLIFEELLGVQVQTICASEFRYRNIALNENDCVIAISQSGETADTLEAIKISKEKGALTLGIVNGIASSIARETHAGVYNHIGMEVAVASTKAFTSQIVICILFALKLHELFNGDKNTRIKIINELEKIPEHVAHVLKSAEEIKRIASAIKDVNNIACLGRKMNGPIAFEGALKLKEITYMHAEGFLSGELKHGSLALVDKSFPSIFIAPQDSVYSKNVNSIEEIKARNGSLIIIGTKGDDNVHKYSDNIISIPKTHEILTPLLSVIPFQLLTLYIGIERGVDIDQPRNLAKSVTVE